MRVFTLTENTKKGLFVVLFVTKVFDRWTMWTMDDALKS